MKRSMLIILAVFLVTVIPGPGKSSALDTQGQTGVHFDWWESNVHTKGRQFYIPIKIEGQYKELSYGILSGYAYTHYDPNDSGARSWKDPLDTKVNISYELFDVLPVNMIFGLDLNLPTGERDLQAEFTLLTDSDLFSIKSAGEGFNINPTLNLSKGWGQWVGAIGLGYVWRGKYDYSINIKDYDPGDIINVTAEIDYDFSLEWRTRFFCNYAYYYKDRVQNQDLYQEGDFFLFGLGLHYDRIKWDSEAILQGIFRGKSKFRTGGMSQELSKAERNNYGDEWIAQFSLTYFLDELNTLKSFLEILRVDENDYPFTSLFFVGSREKFSLGAGLKRILTDRLEAEFTMEAFVMKDEATFFNPDRERYQGFSIESELTARF